MRSGFTRGLGPPMPELIDYSYARFSPAEVKALGRVGVIRYVASGRPEVSATRAEVDSFRAAGLAFVAVWQFGKTRPLLGKAAGVADGNDALTYTAGLGRGKLDPVHFSVDFPPTTAQLPTVLAYFEGVASVLGWANVGAYANAPTINYLHERTPIPLFWLHNWGSAGQVPAVASLHQYQINQTLSGRAVDFDRSLKPFYGQWGARMAVAELYPGARWYPLGAQTEARMTAHDIACAHTMVGYLSSTDPYFRIYNGVGYAGTESHIGIGGKWGPDLGGGLDGASWQWQDFAYQADANLDGNYRVISFETADNAPATPDEIAAWTPAQVEEIIRFLDWICSPAAHAKCPTSWRCHSEGIPRALIPDSKPGRRGIGYHAQGAAERVPGGEAWSTSSTKPCPAWRRIAQLKTVIVPRVAALGSGQEDPMAAFTEADIRRFVREETNKELAKVYNLLGYGDERIDTKPDTHPNNMQQLRKDVAELRALVEERHPAPAPAPDPTPEPTP